jgi:MFS family permease
VRRNVVVAALGITQTLAWGSSYYLPAILAEPIAEGLGLSRAMVFGVFSGSLLLSALLGPAVGRVIDNRGGRGVLVLSNAVLAAGLVWLALAQGIIGLGAAWAVLGVGMALGLYDSAFATLTGLYGRAARAPITGITLIAGFASTIGWPLSAFLDARIGWRGACLIWAALNLLVCLPLNRLLIPRAPPPEPAPEPGGSPTAPPRAAMPILAFVFAATWFVTGAMAAHMPRLLEIAGASSTAAIAAAALVGPAQVGARLVEFGSLALESSARFSSDCGCAASGRRGNSLGVWCTRDHGLRTVPWIRKRLADDCQGHTASRDLWTDRLRAAQWGSCRTGACGAGDVPTHFRASDGLARCRGALNFRRAKHCGSACLNGTQSAHRACGCAVKGVASRFRTTRG